MSHINYALDYTVEVFIVHDHKVLLRKHDKHKIWLSVGGHIETGEDPTQAALREVKEEVGLDVLLYAPEQAPSFEEGGYQELVQPTYMNRHRINDHHEHLTFVYFATTHSPKLTLSKTELSDGVKWFGLEELSQPEYDVRSSIQFYAKKALESAKQSAKRF
ncbi:hypothetical protein COT72_04280 [archaeon CG10_big_fil_rev_8_21_14_0_10_43_11]|nr:MAG: hypothetical protein COT72_04280 [archaeon CG10_big_fil_rev_8_21_14_0_10_43_11]